MNSLVRREFQELDRIVFLNSAAMSLMPRRAKAAVSEALADREMSSEERTLIRLARENRTRHKIAQLIGSSPEEVCIVTSTSEGVNIIARGLRLRRGDNVILGENEHIANVLPWLNMEKAGVRVKRIGAEYGKDFSDSLLAAVDSRTRVIAVSFVGWIDGFRIDLAKIGGFCREHDIFLSVDAIQGIGALDLDVTAAHVSFLSCGGSKWLMSPNGTGFLFVRKDLVAELESTYLSYLSVDADAESFDFRIRLKEDAGRFRLGSINDIGIAAMEESVDLILRMGIKNIQARIMELTSHAAAGLAEKGYRIVSDLSPERRSGIISFCGRDTLEKYRDLLSRGIIVSLRNRWIRISPHFYNDLDDIGRLLEAL